jgi:hypothetical protein
MGAKAICMGKTLLKEKTCGSLLDIAANRRSLVGAAEGCDLLMLFFIIKIKRSQPAAAPCMLPSHQSIEI